jgi:hypothetical protein
MEFTAVVKAALELGIIPTLALFLVVSVLRQNKKLLEDRRETELQLLKTLGDMARDNQQAMSRLYDRLSFVQGKEQR